MTSLTKQIDAKVHKRPLYHPPIPSPYAGASRPKVIYVKPSTPFMSAVHRVRGLLKQIDKRGLQSATEQTRHIKGDRILAQARLGVTEASMEEVTIKGTGRAIEKVLGLAAWFGDREKEEGVRVRLGTGSVTAIDDILLDEEHESAETESSTNAKDDNGINGDNEELPESRLRQISVLEVKISLQ
jgi:ribonuclease P/MRP protein subunit POP7